MRVYDSSRWLPAMEQPPTTNEPDACNWRLHEKKQATTTPSKNHNHIPHVYSGLVTHLRKEWRCERVLVEGKGRGSREKDIFTGKEGKSGTARAAAVNVVRTISTIIRRLLVERNEGHLFRTISSFATLINHRRSLDRNSRVEADGTKESVLER